MRGGFSTGAGPDHSAYYFAPKTVDQNSERRKDAVHLRDESPFWVEVAISKANGDIDTRKYRGKEFLPRPAKYRGEQLVCQASGPDFQKANNRRLVENEPDNKRHKRTERHLGSSPASETARFQARCCQTKVDGRFDRC